jgi:hypothetical protein
MDRFGVWKCAEGEENVLADKLLDASIPSRDSQQNPVRVVAIEFRALDLVCGDEIVVHPGDRAAQRHWWQCNPGDPGAVDCMRSAVKKLRDLLRPEKRPKRAGRGGSMWTRREMSTQVPLDQIAWKKQYPTLIANFTFGARPNRCATSLFRHGPLHAHQQHRRMRFPGQGDGEVMLRKWPRRVFVLKEDCAMRQHVLDCGQLRSYVVSTTPSALVWHDLYLRASERCCHLPILLGSTRF